MPGVRDRQEIDAQVPEFPFGIGPKVRDHGTAVVWFQGRHVTFLSARQRRADQNDALTLDQPDWCAGSLGNLVYVGRRVGFVRRLVPRQSATATTIAENSCGLAGVAVARFSLVMIDGSRGLASSLMSAKVYSRRTAVGYSYYDLLTWRDGVRFRSVTETCGANPRNTVRHTRHAAISAAAAHLPGVIEL